MKTQQEQLLELRLRDSFPAIVEEIRQCLSLFLKDRLSMQETVSRMRLGVSGFVKEAGFEIGQLATNDLADWVGREFCKIVLSEPPMLPHSITDLRDRFVPHELGGDLLDRLVYRTLLPLRFCRNERSPYHKAAMELSQYIEDSGLREHFIDIEW